MKCPETDLRRQGRWKIGRSPVSDVTATLMGCVTHAEDAFAAVPRRETLNL